MQVFSVAILYKFHLSTSKYIFHVIVIQKILFPLLSRSILHAISNNSCFQIVVYEWTKNFYLFSKTFIGNKWRAKWRSLAQFDIGYGVRGWPGRPAGLKPGQTAISNRYSRKHWTTVLQDESINLPLNSDRNCAFAQMFARDSHFSIVKLYLRDIPRLAMNVLLNVF